MYRRMMGMPPVSATPASDQSAHSALHLPSSGGWPGLTPPLAAAHAQAQAHAAVAAALPPQQAYQQQHAQPPHGGQHGQQLSQQASQQQRGGYTPGRLAAGVAARLAGSAAAPPSGGTFMRSAPKNVRCICNVPGERGRMVQCGGRACGVWQHCECLGLRAPPDRFLCELCRRALPLRVAGGWEVCGPTCGRLGSWEDLAKRARRRRDRARPAAPRTRAAAPAARRCLAQGAARGPLLGAHGAGAAALAPQAHGETASQRGGRCALLGWTRAAAELACWLPGAAPPLGARLL